METAAIKEETSEFAIDEQYWRRLLDMLDGWYHYFEYGETNDVEQKLVDEVYGEAQNLFVNDGGTVKPDKETVRKFIMEKVIPLVLEGKK